MKLTISRDALFDALQKVQNVVEKKSTVQILSNVLLTVARDTMIVTATDLEVGVSVTVPLSGRSGSEGKVALSAKSLVDIVRELPNKPITLEKRENNWVHVSCQKSVFNLVGLGAEEFPPLPSFDNRAYVEMNAALICEMIDKTLFSSSTDETRYHLNGVFLETIENGLLRMVATDGHRLAFIDRELILKNGGSDYFKNGVIIPKKGLIEMKRLLDSKGAKNESFHAAVDKNSLLVRLDNTSLFIRLIDGDYPDYEQVIPKKSPRRMVTSREDFLASLKRASLFANEKSKGVKLSINSSLLTVTSSNPDLGEAKEEIDVDYSGDPVEIGFNARYLVECLSVIHGEKISLDFNDKLSAGVLRPLGREDYTYVVMPMRI